jgi:hypothetical protein
VPPRRSWPSLVLPRPLGCRHRCCCPPPGLDPALLPGPTPTCCTQELRLWDEAARLTGDRDFGLHLAEWAVRLLEEQFDVLAFAVRSCATLGEHYRWLGATCVSSTRASTCRWTEESDVARLVHGHYQEPATPRSPGGGSWRSRCCRLAGPLGRSLHPRRSAFTHARPAQVTEHERIFRAPVHYGCPRNELLLDRVLLWRPQRHAEPRLLAMLDRQLAGLLSELPDRSLGTRSSAA